MQNIKQAAVIGAGTMGSQIAAVIANSNTKVLLLDIVPKGANDRDTLAKEAIQKLKDSGKIFFSENAADNIKPGNMEDDLDKLQQVDWVIECVPEDEKIKYETYRKIGKNTGKDTLVSSNTSTFPLKKLKEGLDSSLQGRLCITHFFNPPTKMPLVEVVTDNDNNPKAVEVFTDFADKILGKNVVLAKDTPGFITNRIGMFWILCAMEEAKNENIPIEMADEIMDGAFGFPKTGVFGLADLVGLKLIPDISNSMCEYLPSDDNFCKLKEGLELLHKRINEGNTGKSKAGFYKKQDEEKQVLDLKTGDYRDIQKSDINIDNWHEFLQEDTPKSRFAEKVILRLLQYSAQVAPDIADSIIDIDNAMKDGYGWKYGPFEIMDHFGISWLIERMEKENMHPPLLLKEAENKRFYPLEDGAKRYMDFSGQYHKIAIPKDKWKLALRTSGTHPVLQSETAKLWDIGDGISCLEFTAKMGTIDSDTLDFIMQSTEKTESEFIGLVIGHDGKHFSAGLDLNIILESARNNNWKQVEEVIKQGQDTMVRLKTAKVPVVPALCGYVLGGACELTMSCVAAQAHTNTNIGLVEVDIGVIPAWGGTKEHLVRAANSASGLDNIINKVLKSFYQITNAQKSTSAREAFNIGLLDNKSRITNNRERLLYEAKQLCLKLAENYHVRESGIIEVPVTALHERIMLEVENIYNKNPDMDLHKKKTLRVLAETLSGYRASQKMEKQNIEQPRAGWNKLSERDILNSSKDAFMELVQTKEALEKVKKVLKKN